MLRELIKSLYAIANAIKGESGGGNNDNVENNYIKFIQPVGIVHVTRSDPPTTETVGDIANTVISVVIDEYRQQPINDYGQFGNMNNSYFLIYNRADIENGVNDKFEYGYYTTNDNKILTVYISNNNINGVMSLKEGLQMMRPNVVNPKFDEINVSTITESNLEDFVVVLVEFTDNR